MSFSDANCGSLRSGDLLVLPDAGEMCIYQRTQDDFDISENVVVEALQSIPAKLRATLGNIRVLKRKKAHLAISPQDVDLDHIARFTRRVQTLIKKIHCSVVALIHADKASQYGTALMLAMSPEDFDCTPQPSILLACSRQPHGVSGTDAMETLQDSLILSRDLRMRGRIGVLYDEKVLAPAGLHRPTETDKHLHSRFPFVAEKYPSGNWGFGDANPEQFSIGRPSVPFRLDNNVWTITLDNAEGGGAMGVMTNANAEGRVKGIVLRTDANEEPLSSIALELQKRLRQIRVPIILTGRNVQSPVPGDFPKHEGNIVSAHSMTSGESKIILSHALADAPPNPDDLMPHVLQRFREYPLV